MISAGQIIILVAFMLISMIISSQLRSRFQRYSRIAVNYGLTGKDVAEKMLRENGITDVSVMSVQGELTDHYNPANKTINLSRDVYYGQSVSAAAVAAHETGHAVQHHKAYAMLQFRTALVPLQNISAKVMNFIFIAMLLGVFAIPRIFNFELAITIIIACYAIFTLFALVTLPVEIDASRRALAWLSNSNVTSVETYSKAKDALKWAAYTYVVAALSSLAMLLYFLFMLLGRRN